MSVSINTVQGTASLAVPYVMGAITGSTKRVVSQIMLFNSSVVSNANEVVYIRGAGGHVVLRLIIGSQQSILIGGEDFKWVQNSEDSTRLEISAPSASIANPIYIKINYSEIV